MKLRHGGELVLIASWLAILASPIHAVNVPVAGPRIGDVDTRWYLMMAPFVPFPGGGLRVAAPTAPISRWTIVGTFPTKKECDLRRRLGVQPWIRCISANELAHAKAMHTPGWLLMIAPNEDSTAPLAQWTPIKDTTDFPTEKSCSQYRSCLYSQCLRPGVAIRQPSILGWWSEMRERREQRNRLRASRCVADDDRRLKEK